VNALSGVRIHTKIFAGNAEEKRGSRHIPVEMIHYGMTKTAHVAVARGLAESVAAGLSCHCAARPEPQALARCGGTAHGARSKKVLGALLPIVPKEI
jgi:hypothetical protein